MVMLGCAREDQLKERHDIFFRISSTLMELIPQRNTFCSEVKGKIYSDTCVKFRW